MKKGTLDKKLRRLPGSNPAAIKPAVGGSVADDLAQPLGAEPVLAQPSEVLKKLRAQMQALLRDQKLSDERTVGPHAAPAVGSLTTTFDRLPLVRFERTEGHLWRRRVRIPVEYRVGHRACHAGVTTDLRLLALLALDPQLSEFGVEQALFLDTETTGFGGAGTLAFLVGVAFVEAGQLWVEQLMLEGPEQEPALLAHIREYLQHKPLLVSFNGKSFDWPLLKGRFVMNRCQPPDDPKHLDLLHVARRVHKQRLKRCSLQALEAHVLGFERIGDVDGAEVAARYLHFSRTGDASGLEAVLEHNYWDVLSMVALVGVYGPQTLGLPSDDVSGAAVTLARARALPDALKMAQRAVALARADVQGEQERAHLVRGEIRKALGDKRGALDDFQTAVSSPKARLELAKLYEHLVKDPILALQVVEQGTTEKPAAADKRRSRLLRKRG